MSSVIDHYEKHLAPVCLWMAGGIDNALARGQQELLHERKEGAWVMRVSAYRKLRLAPGWVKQQLEECGFIVSINAGVSGMIRIIATKA